MKKFGNFMKSQDESISTLDQCKSCYKELVPLYNDATKYVKLHQSKDPDWLTWLSSVKAILLHARSILVSQSYSELDLENQLSILTKCREVLVAVPKITLDDAANCAKYHEIYLRSLGNHSQYEEADMLVDTKTMMPVEETAPTNHAERVKKSGSTRHK